MYKVILLIALAVAGSFAQEGPNAAPEPYSYAYETDSHAAAEQRDPSGKVSGYYTIVGEDGRQRRVDYVADEAGFRAKVQTNEVGTKSENSADVEVLASPPTREQLEQTVVSGQQQQLQQQQQVVRQQFTSQQQAFAAPQQQQQGRYSLVTSTQQPAGAGYGYGYYPGYGYGSNYGYGAGYYGTGPYGPAGYGSSAQYRVGYANQGQYGANPGQFGAQQGQFGAQQGQYGANTVNTATQYKSTYTGYNNHLPSAYYRSVSTGSNVQPVAYSSGSRVVSSSVVTPAQGSYVNGVYRSGSYQSSVGPVPTAGYGYTASSGVGAVPARSAYSTVGSSSNSNLSGSSNYIVLKAKREVETEAEKKN